MTVALHHLTADMPGEGFGCLLAHVRIFGEPRNERMPHIVRPVTHTSDLAGDSPGFAPRTHRAVEINVPESRYPRISGKAHFVVRENEAIQPGIREAFEPQRQTGANATRQWNYAASTCSCLTFRHDYLALYDRTICPFE